MDTRTRRTSLTITLIATLVAGVLLLGSLLFVFLLVFEFHNLCPFFAENLTALLLC